MENLIYVNAFRLVQNDVETQIVLKVETPIVNEENNTIEGTKVIDVADVRMNTSMARQLYMSLKERFECEEG